MPTRQYSSMTLAGSWPLTDPQNFHSTAEAQHAKGAELINCAEEVRRVASGVAANQSGHFIDGFCGWCTRTAGEYVDTADQFFAMSRVSEEVGRLLYGLREDLDEIDRRAHEEIQRIQQSVGVGRALQDGAQIMAILAKARAEAQAKAAAVAGKIATLGTQIRINPISGTGTGGGPASQPPPGADPVDPTLGDMQNRGFGGGGRPGPGGMPTGLGPKPLDPPPSPPQNPPPKLGDQQGGDLPADQLGGQGANPPGGVTGAGDNPPGPKPHRPQMGNEQVGPGFMPPGPIPFAPSGGPSGSPAPVSSPGGGGPGAFAGQL